MHTRDLGPFQVALISFRRVIRQARILFVSVVALALIVTGAAFAATRASAPKIGTGVVVINTNLALQNASAAGTEWCSRRPAAS